MFRKGLVIGRALLSWSFLHLVDEHGRSDAVCGETDVRVVEKTREPLLELLLPPDVFGKVWEHLTQASEVLLARLEKDVPLVLAPLAKFEERTPRHLVHRPHTRDVEAEVADREVVLAIRVEQNDSFLRIVHVRLVLEQLVHVAVLSEGNDRETEFHAHRMSPFSVWILRLLHAVLPIKQRELQAKLREIPYWKELYFSVYSIADCIVSVKPSWASKKTSVLGLFSTLFLIKNFSFLLSKSPIRFCPENSIQTGRRAKRGGFLWLAISEMVRGRGFEPPRPCGH